MSKQFTIHMPSPKLHAIFERAIEYEIQRFIDKHKSNSDGVVAKIAEGMIPTGAGDIPIPDDEFYKGNGPDASFQLEGCDYPGLVIVVAWGNGNKLDLNAKAKYYFESSQGEIRTFIGLNLNDIYEEQQSAEKKWGVEQEKWKKGKLSSPPPPLTFLAPSAAAMPADFSVLRARHNSQTRKTTIQRNSVRNQACLTGPSTCCGLRFLISS